MVSPTARRAMVSWAQEAYQLTQRRACRAVQVNRALLTYRSICPSQAPLRQRLRELAKDRLSFGYQRLHVLLKREGWTVNHKRVLRLYREEQLSLTRKRPRRRKMAVTRPVRESTTSANERWAMDFMHDVLASGQKIRIFTMVDVHTRECLTLVGQPTFRGDDVARILTTVRRERGGAPVMQVDNGTEFTSHALDQWAYEQQVRLDFSRPAKPVDNCVVEAFNGSLRRECLSQHWFATLAEAQALLNLWREDYNLLRPHKGLAYQTPAAFAASVAGGHFIPNHRQL
jgi:putative transposase